MLEDGFICHPYHGELVGAELVCGAADADEALVLAPALVRSEHLL